MIYSVTYKNRKGEEITYNQDEMKVEFTSSDYKKFLRLDLENIDFFNRVSKDSFKWLAKHLRLAKEMPTTELVKYHLDGAKKNAEHIKFELEMLAKAVNEIEKDYGLFSKKLYEKHNRLQLSA